MGLYINGDKLGKPYINGIKHNAFINGQKIWIDGPIPPPGPVPPDDSVFSFDVADAGSFSIPLAGIQNSTSGYQSYNWIVNWGDGQITTHSGTGSYNVYISHTYSDGKKKHTIKIMPNGNPTQGWFNAFGTSYQDRENPAKIKKVNSVITELMRNNNSFSHCNMFLNCTGLTSVPENLLPRTSLGSYAYAEMFQNCTSLTSIPNLPVTTISNHSFRGMFQNCTSLTFVPNGISRVTNTTEGGLQSMFQGCTGLISLDDNLLPLLPPYSGYFYTDMFRNCTSLTDIGTMDAAWFSARSSQPMGMFAGCTNITTPITYANIPINWKR
jgi:hypothetical protein